MKKSENYLNSTVSHYATPDMLTLSDEEEGSPYAHFYYLQTPLPDSGHFKLMDEPSDANLAIEPHQLNDLLSKKLDGFETGWCILNNGSGYIANKMLYPDVTAEMIDWWFSWHPLDSLRYKIWYPSFHEGVSVSESDRLRLGNSSLPVRERNWGVTHHVVENTSGEMENIRIQFMSPADFGFDMSRWHDFGNASFFGGQGWTTPIDDNQDLAFPALMCHIFRDTQNGLEHTTRFWLGYFLKNGEAHLVLPPEISVPETVVQGLARHAVNEFTRLQYILPDLYKEFSNN
ncbi:DAPG hydrolase family protein [Klebsiella pneumoniae]|uniref:DAPG hydrolase family protein n=1 Tax=Klebsiella pneumoniae TaxID=573 RepID=UPI001ABCC64F|nr:hypothetical protein [Klebsiella pneumoniae]MBO3721288.1 hypothetical protein [Klebsiella pneumoniae]HCM5830590.1 hypothetical protein [Klebsiella pneumoniae]